MNIYATCAAAFLFLTSTVTEGRSSSLEDHNNDDVLPAMASIDFRAPLKEIVNRRLTGTLVDDDLHIYEGNIKMPKKFWDTVEGKHPHFRVKTRHHTYLVKTDDIVHEIDEDGKHVFSNFYVSDGNHHVVVCPERLNRSCSIYQHDHTFTLMDGDDEFAPEDEEDVDVGDDAVEDRRNSIRSLSDQRVASATRKKSHPKSRPANSRKKQNASSTTRNRKLGAGRVVLRPNSSSKKKKKKKKGCFSRVSTVRVEGKEKPVQMKRIKIGDRILTPGGNYETVYAWSHIDRKATVDYIQLHTKDNKKLEISRDHYVYLKDGTVRAAGKIAVGDLLASEEADGRFHEIARIYVVSRKGLFAPLTKSGKLLVDGVACSCFVTFNKDLSPNIQIGSWGTPFTFHGLQQLFFSPYRLATKLFPSFMFLGQEKETTNSKDEAEFPWIAEVFLKRSNIVYTLANHGGINSALAQLAIYACFLPILLLFYGAEKLLLFTPAPIATTAGVTSLAVGCASLLIVWGRKRKSVNY